MAEPPSAAPPSAVPTDTSSPYIGITGPDWQSFTARGRASVNDRSAMEAESRGVYNARVQPYYRNGQERTMFSGKSPEDIAGIQRMMTDAGLLTGTSYRYGSLDDTTVEAFKQVLAFANIQGLTAQEALTTMRRSALQTPQPQLPTNGGRQPLVTQITDPAELRRAFRSAVQGVTGRVDDEYVDSLVSAYQQRESGAQQAAYGMAGASGGTVTTPPDPTSFAEDRARQDRPEEVGANSLANTFNDFQSLLGGLGSGN